MNSHELTRDLRLAFPSAPGDLRRLHTRLAEKAQRDGILDVAYRTVDSPVGPLLLAATEAGLVRVAYANEDHDAVLQALADKISPRVLNAPARLETAVRELDEYFTGRRPAGPFLTPRPRTTSWRPPRTVPGTALTATSPGQSRGCP